MRRWCLIGLIALGPFNITAFYLMIPRLKIALHPFNVDALPKSASGPLQQEQSRYGCHYPDNK